MKHLGVNQSPYSVGLLVGEKLGGAAVFATLIYGNVLNRKLPASGLVMPGSFLHSVLLVDVQFFTTSSSLLHLA